MFEEYFDIQLKTNPIVTQEQINDIIDQQLIIFKQDKDKFSHEYVQDYINYMNSKIGKQILLYAIPKFIGEYDKKYIWSDEIHTLTDLSYCGNYNEVPMFKIEKTKIRR